MSDEPCTCTIERLPTGYELYVRDANCPKHKMEWDNIFDPIVNAKMAIRYLTTSYKRAWRLK